MMINYPRNPYDKRLEIMKMTVSEDITHDDDQLSTKTTQEHEDAGITEPEEDFEEEESLFEDIECYIFYFARWCVMIYVSFRIQSGVLCFWGVFGFV